MSSTALAAAASLLAAAPAAAADPVWVRQNSAAGPIAAIGLANGVGVSVLCRAGEPAYSLLVIGPANGQKPGESVTGWVEGAHAVKLRFSRVTVDGDKARIATAGGLRGTTGDQSGALYAIEAIRAATKTVTIRLEAFSVTVPASGVAEAFVPLVEKCGSIKKMADTARAKAYNE